MKSVSVLFAFDISSFSFKELENGVIPFKICYENSCKFPNCEKILVLCSELNKNIVSSFLENVKIECNTLYEIIALTEINVYSIFLTISKFVTGNKEFDHVFFSYADTPFIDLKLTKALFDQHIEYSAEYSFIDGYPEGFAPEIIASGLCSILTEASKTDSDFTDVVPRSFIFDTIKKEINNYDIETLIAPIDLRHLRLRFVCDNKRNTELCNRFIGINAENYAEFIKEREDKLFTFPAYYSIEISGKKSFKSIYTPQTLKKFENMEFKDFSYLVEKISEFSDDAVISLSIFNEPAFNKYIIQMIQFVLTFPNLSILIETNGLEWSNEQIENINQILNQAPKRNNGLLPLYWIVCIDAVSSSMYGKVHGLPEDEANLKLKKVVSFTDKIHKSFKNAVWTQIVRMNENEVEIEPFYRFWKDLGLQVIIQKYDSFCKVLEDKRVADLSPFYRYPCWHIKRDMNIFPDGSVPMCREDFELKNILGNAFSDNFEYIQNNAFKIYRSHLNCEYGGLCEFCDEYYTYNF